MRNESKRQCLETRREAKGQIQSHGTEMNQNEVEMSLAETESALVNAASSLVDHERRERFIGERIGYYRTLIRRRKDVIQILEADYSSNRSEDDNDEDLECSTLSPTNPRKTRQHDERLVALRTKHMTDEASLQGVVELHKSIIAEIETLRRRVEDLTEKRDNIVKKMEKCRDLIVDSSTVDW